MTKGSSIAAAIAVCVVSWVAVRSPRPSSSSAEAASASPDPAVAVAPARPPAPPDVDAVPAPRAPPPRPRDLELASAPEIQPAAPVSPIPSATDEVLASMRREVDQLRWQLSEQQQRVAALQADVANERAQRSREADATAARTQGLNAIAQILVEVDGTLASGSRHVGDRLAQAEATAASVASSAATSGAAMQATFASYAQLWIAASREALAHGDLRETRVDVERAAALVRAAALATAVAGSEAATASAP